MNGNWKGRLDAYRGVSCFLSTVRTKHQADQSYQIFLYFMLQDKIVFVSTGGAFSRRPRRPDLGAARPGRRR